MMEVCLGLGRFETGVIEDQTPNEMNGVKLQNIQRQDWSFERREILELEMELEQNRIMIALSTAPFQRVLWSQKWGLV